VGAGAAKVAGKGGAGLAGKGAAGLGKGLGIAYASSKAGGKALLKVGMRDAMGTASMVKAAMAATTTPPQEFDVSGMGLGKDVVKTRPTVTMPGFFRRGKLNGYFGNPMAPGAVVPERYATGKGMLPNLLGQAFSGRGIAGSFGSVGGAALGQAKAGAGHAQVEGALAAEEALEYAVDLGGRNADARVPDAELDLLSGQAGGEIQ
jgi:hypothetical protein